MEKDVLYHLMYLSLRELVFNVPQDDRIGILKYAYETELISKAKDIGYQIVKLRKKGEPDKKLIDELLLQIKEIIKNVPYSLEEKFVADGIEAIFDEAKKL